MTNLAGFEPAGFAAQWAAAWNRRDVEAVLAHFSEETVFTSPTALAVTGAAVVRGKPALRAYWNLAMAKISSLHFTVDRVLWEAPRSELAIIYVSVINGASKKVSENLLFDADGKVGAAEVFHGAPW
jgi:ketosteroid isomerase-like protein